MPKNQIYSTPFSDLPEIASQRSTLSLGITMLVIFAFFRPLTLTFVEVKVFGLSAFEIFGIVISYMLLIPVLLNFRSLQLDRITLLSIYFCLYCLASILWGSNIAIFARVVLPFIVFLAVRIYITEEKLIGIILIAIAAGYFIPIGKSTYDIVVGRSIEFVNWWSGMKRFEGSYGGSHTLAYAMLFFSFIYCLLNRTRPLSGRITKIVLFVFLLLTMFCLYKSYTRTVIFGFIIFWSMYLLGANKKRFVLAMVLCVLAAAINFQRIERIFWQTGGHEQIGYHNLNAASSGRLMLWQHNIQLFIESPIPLQLLGRGLGCDSRTDVDFEASVWEPHNNYLNLLMSLGVIGLFIYLTLLVFLLWDIYKSKLDKSGKCLFAGIVLSVAFMNFVSNAVIFRIELSQYFWLFMGFFYFLKEKSEADELPSKELFQSPPPGSYL